MKTVFLFLFIYIFPGILIYPQVNLSKGLVAYYPFNGNANDLSGNGNHAVFNNAVLTSDKAGNSGRAYYFDGKTQYMRIANNRSLNFAGAFTISLQVKPMGFYGGPCHGNRIIMKGEDDFESGNYYITFDDNYSTGGKNCENQYPDVRRQVFYAPNTSNFKKKPEFVVPGKWYTLTYISNGKYCSFYIDCRIVATGSTAGMNFSNRHDLFFGKMNHWKFPYWYKGALDEVRFYNRAVNMDELNELCSIVPPVKKPAAKKTGPAQLPVKVPAAKPPKPVIAPALAKPRTSAEKIISAPATVKKAALENKTSPQVLGGRLNNIIKTIETGTDSVTVDLYDNGEVDGDTISVYFNGKMLVDHQRLHDKPITVIIKPDPKAGENYFVMYAENLGEIPPNTALMVVTTGGKRYEVFMQSTEKTNGMVVFKAGK